MSSIPVVNLAQFTGGDSAQKQDFVAALGSAFEQVGFVSVVSHGIPGELIEKLYSESRGFFALPLQVKEKYNIPGLAGQRGYTSFGTEHAKGFDLADLKEFFQFGQEIAPDAVSGDYPANVTVDELPEFTPTLLETYRAFEHSGASLLQAIALHLGLNESYFDQWVHNGNSILRAIYYPPITSDPQSAIRSEQHEDINLITLLVGASADGLEIMDKNGAWLAVTTEPGQIVVNVGDMLQRLTNNRLKSTTHRVVNPPRESWSRPRYSMPFFLHPRSDMSLACLESCITGSQPKAYPDYTAGEYLDERLREIGLKK